MENTNPLNPDVNGSFLFWWVLVNLVGLPALLLPYGIGYFILGYLVVMGDGTPIGPLWYIIIFIILAFSGALMGAWLGLMQWLPLQSRIEHSRKWIGVSALGVAIGAPLSSLVYRLILEFPIVHFIPGYAYVTFSILLGLSIGVAQWSALRQQVEQAGWWIIIVPVSFTLGVSFINIYISNMQGYDFSSVLSALIALVGVGSTTGILLRGLLQFPKAQRASR